MARDSHPDQQLGVLEKALRSGLPRGVLLRGEEAWYRERARRSVADAARAAGQELREHDGSDPDFSLQTLFDDLRGGSLFAPACCVVVQNPGQLLRKTAAGDAPLAAALVRFLDAPEPEGCLVVVAPGLRADHAVAKAVARCGGPVLSFRKLWDTPPPWERRPDPRRTELVEWLLARARTSEVRLSAENAAWIAASTGNELHLLETQLEKLRLAGGDARELGGGDAAVVPFRVARALLEGDLRSALSGIEGLFRGGMKRKDGRREVDRNALLPMLLGALRNDARRALAEALEGAPAGGGASRLPRARRTPEAWEALLADVVDLERRSRTWGTVDANDLFALALRWCAEPPGARRTARNFRSVRPPVRS